MTHEDRASVTVRQAAERLGVHVQTVRRWLQPDDNTPPLLEGFRLSNKPLSRWRIYVDSIERLEANRTTHQT